MAKTAKIEVRDLVKVSVASVNKQKFPKCDKVKMGWMGEEYELEVEGEPVLMPKACVEHYQYMFQREEKRDPGSTINPVFKVTKP